MKYIGSRADFMGNYPPGAAHDPRAPYNQVDPPERCFNVSASYTLNRSVDVTTSEYDDDEMLQIKEDYESEYDTPKELIRFAEQCAKFFLSRKDYSLESKWRLKKILDSCSGWDEADWSFEQL